jgi:hypothetical protein
VGLAEALALCVRGPRQGGSWRGIVPFCPSLSLSLSRSLALSLALVGCSAAVRTPPLIAYALQSGITDAVGDKASSRDEVVESASVAVSLCLSLALALALALSFSLSLSRSRSCSRSRSLALSQTRAIRSLFLSLYPSLSRSLARSQTCAIISVSLSRALLSLSTSLFLSFSPALSS